MSNAKFTKGPWIAYTDVKEPVINSLGENYEPQICLVSEIEAESEANAHLIAAAPEMYEEIESLVGCIDSMLKGTVNADDIDAVLRYAKQILAKARGEK